MPEFPAGSTPEPTEPTSTERADTTEPAVASEEDTARIVGVAMDLARVGDAAELVRFVEHGLPVNVTDPAGNTLLMLAAYHGHADAVSRLIACGADVDRPNDRGQTPVAGAIFKGEDAVVRLLVAAGADLDAGTPPARATAQMFGQQHLLEPEEG